MTILMRSALQTDLPQIIEIYNSTIPSRMSTADLHPVTVESRLPWFKEHQGFDKPLIVYEEEDKIKGWISLSSFYGRPAYQNTVEISLYVDPNHHRQGIGKELLTYILYEPRFSENKTILAFIFAHNLPSLNLFKSYNFLQWGYLPQVAELDGIKRDLVILGWRKPETTI